MFACARPKGEQSERDERSVRRARSEYLTAGGLGALQAHQGRGAAPENFAFFHLKYA